MHRVPDVHQRRRGDEDDLQDPETDVGDGEGLVVADVLATWLLGVAHEVRLLIPPHELCCSAEDEDPKDEKHREPNAADDRGVLIDLLQDVPQETPVPHDSPTCRKEKAKLSGHSAIRNPHLFANSRGTSPPWVSETVSGLTVSFECFLRAD